MACDDREETCLGAASARLRPRERVSAKNEESVAVRGVQWMKVRNDGSMAEAIQRRRRSQGDNGEASREGEGRREVEVLAGRNEGEQR